MIRSLPLLALLACTGDSDSTKVPGDDATGSATTTPPGTTGLTDPGTDPGTTTPGTTTTTEERGLLEFDEQPTNLIIISLDTTRRDHIGRFATAGDSLTPNLDAFLDEAVALDNHRSCSNWTAPSMTCVVTGALPMEHNWWPWHFGSDPIPTVKWDLPTLAVQMREQAGYTTSVITANSVFGDDFGLNMAFGFESVREVDQEPAEYITDLAVGEAQRLFDGTDPFYFHVHFMDPHANYCPPESYIDPEYSGIPGYDLCWDFYWITAYTFPYWQPALQQSFIDDILELYQAELRYWDVHFGRLIDELDAIGALDDTLVVFVTDHGEQFFERGDMGHGNVLGAEENRATAAFWAKDLPAASWNELTVHQDIAVTIQSMYGLKAPQGTSGEVIGNSNPDRIIRSMNNWFLPQLSVVQGDVQLRYDWWGDRMLHRFDKDPDGLIDFYEVGSPEAAALWPEMDVFIADIEAMWPFIEPPAPVER